MQSIISANTVNVKDIVDVINTMTQVATARQWAEAMHISGLFDYLLNSVVKDKVSGH